MSISLAAWKNTFCGMPNSKKYWKVFGKTDLLNQVSLYYLHWLDHKRDTYFIEQMEDFINRSREVILKMDTQFATKTDCKKKTSWNNIPLAVSPIELGNCKAATPCQPPPLPYGCFPGDEVKVKNAMQFATKTDCMQKQGNNPMRIDNTTATAYVTTPKSDDATSREYLLGRLSLYNDGWRNPKMNELAKLFNLSEDGRPKTYLQLIDAIKNDKFSLDPKVVARLKRIQDDLEEEDEEDFEDYGYGPFYGVIFNDFPKPDREGYDAAVKQFNDLLKATKDTIMVKSPDDGLTALQALEAWVPVGKAN